MMCLRYKTDMLPESDIGYKVMYKTPDGTYRSRYRHHHSDNYSLGQEYCCIVDADNSHLYYKEAGGIYPNGFHIYRDLDVAKGHLTDYEEDICIVKVRGRNLLASGNESWRLDRLDLCDVYEYMTILEEVSCV